MTHEEYLKRRDELIKIRIDSFIYYDKAILSLATGSLALSITFLDKIGVPFNFCTYMLIFSTWISFFVVIVANLLSYLFAQSNMDRKIKELDDTYRKEIDKNQYVSSGMEKVFLQITPKNISISLTFLLPKLLSYLFNYSSVQKKISYDKNQDEDVEIVFWQRTATSFCNYISFFAFTFAILFFTCYIIQIQWNNFSNTIAQQKKEESEMAKKISGESREVKVPCRQTGTRGMTEHPKAITNTRTTSAQTESSRPVQKPSTSTIKTDDK